MKIGKYFSFTYFIYIAFIILCLFHKAYGESNIEYEEIDYKDTIENNIVNINGNGNETILKILMKQPDEIYNPEEWSKIHEEKINEYLAENNKNNSELKNIRISITYLEHSPYNSTNYQSSIIPTKSNSTITYSEDDEDDSLYFLDFSDMVNKLESEEKQKYDFVVLDNYMLFSEIALIESELMSRFKNRKPTISYLLNLSENIEKLEKEITFNDPRFLEDAKYNGQYYGLPYELDFNVLFYNNTSDNSNYLAKRMSTISWSGLISSLMAIKSNNNKMTIGLTDDIDFLSYFMEFTSDKYNLSDQADPNFFELFYNKTSDKVYKNFRDYLMSCSSNNITSAFQVTLNDAFTSFKEGRSAFIKGKASYYDIFKKRVSSIENEEGGEGVDEGKLNTFDVSLPPKFKSSIIEKYLCINKHSTHDVSLLTKIALQLTSKQMQLYRAEQFGSIPTFDISKRNDDINTNTYCQTHAKICDMIQNMKHVNLKSIFNSKYSAPLIEIIALLPKHFRKCLVQNEINSMPDVFRSINEPLTNVMSIVNALCYILIIVTSAFTGFTMYLINKYKTNPYIKVFTPSILIITMSGIILNIIKIFQYLSPYFELKTRIVISIETLSDNLIYIPMIMIVYGLITILKGELVNSADKTSENFKKIGVIVIVTISSLFIICRLVTIIFSDFYYESNGNIIQSRFPEIVIGSLTFLNLIYKIYIYTVVSIFKNQFAFK